MMDSISSLMEEVTWRSLAVFLESAAGVAGVAGAEASPKAAEHKAAAICHLIVPNSSMHGARHSSSLRICSKGFWRPLPSRSSCLHRIRFARLGRRAFMRGKKRRAEARPFGCGVALLFGARNECRRQIVAQIDSGSAVLGFADSRPGGDQRLRKALAECSDLGAAHAKAHHLG